MPMLPLLFTQRLAQSANLGQEPNMNRPTKAVRTAVSKQVMSSVLDFRGISGAQKAAILMLSLGNEHSAKLWELLDDEEVEEESLEWG